MSVSCMQISQQGIYNTMMEEIRDAIEAGRFDAYKAKKLDGFKENDRK